MPDDPLPYEQLWRQMWHDRPDDTLDIEHGFLDALTDGQPKPEFKPNPPQPERIQPGFLSSSEFGFLGFMLGGLHPGAHLQEPRNPQPEGVDADGEAPQWEVEENSTVVHQHDDQYVLIVSMDREAGENLITAWSNYLDHNCQDGTEVLDQFFEDIVGHLFPALYPESEEPFGPTHEPEEEGGEE